RIDRMDGILNGTTNYILTRMNDCSSSFEDTLDEAKRLGYAEADPTADVSGADTCRKICILAAVAWGKLVSFESVYCEGITEMREEHNTFAASCGGALKLVATAKKEKETIYLSVSPCVVMADSPLSSVKGVFNAVKVAAGDMGDLMFYGMGAGKFPTAGAVISDILAILRRKDQTDDYCFFKENDLETVAYDEAKSDFCVAVQAERVDMDQRLSAYTLLKEDGDTLYLLCEDVSKRELEKALDGLTLTMLMRAIV
ncbi:MAG: homoserine dehydrogenase, partial [Clostridia bacterium]|nr:homoserine dehydrogenase [Clostridia bacterium]